MRADRLLSILLLLQAYRRLTARDLAERLEVSERTILRDMEALSHAGIPVFAERGTGGGWSLLGEYRTNLTGLNEAEVQALFLARSPQVLDDLGLSKAAEGALLKLLAAVPSTAQQNADAARTRIHVDVSGWQHRPEEAVPLLPLLQQAVWQERKLLMTYQRGDCDAVERLVDPLGLVAKGSVWYFVAGVDDTVRTYRVSRVARVALTEQPCARPTDFDLAAYWQQSNREFKASLPQYHATLRVQADTVLRLYYGGRFARVEQVGEPDGEGRVLVRMRFQFAEEACEFALGFGAQVEVIEPIELRAKIVEMARQVMEFYTGKTIEV